MKEPEFSLMGSYFPGNLNYYAGRVVSGTKFVNYKILDETNALSKKDLEKLGREVEASIVKVLGEFNIEVK